MKKLVTLTKQIHKMGILNFVQLKKVVLKCKSMSAAVQEHRIEQ